MSNINSYKFFVCTVRYCIIAHSDDFRWFGSEDVLYEWEALVKNFNAHKYTVTDCTDKEFVGINITHDEDYNYYMDQTRMITEICRSSRRPILLELRMKDCHTH